MTLGLIINPKARAYHRSNRVRKSLNDLSSHAHTVQLDDFDALPQLLLQLARKNCENLAVSGGDGTVQAVLTHLAEYNPFQHLPTLILLPHGTTNMTAKDVSIASMRKVDRFLAQIADKKSPALSGNIVKRHTVKIENPENRPPQHGMYFGWGAVHRAVLKCQSDVHAMGFTGDVGPALTLLGSWFAHLLGRTGNDPERIVQGEHLRLSADGEIRCDSQQLLLSVTTLDRLIANCRPYWNQSENSLKTTLIAYPVQKALRMLLPALYGAGDRKITAPGYESFSATNLSFKITSDCILDGEIIHPPKNQPLRLSLGPEFAFLKV